MSTTRIEKLNRRLTALFAAAIVLVMTAASFMEPVFAAEGYEDVASSESVERVGKYGMTPISSDAVKDGTYTVDVESSSRFFRITEAKLVVKKGRMAAEILIGSNSYKCVYPGTAEEAAKAPLEDYIMAEETDLGTTFRIPVEALNKELELAAFSRRKNKWYDRLILVDAASLPSKALDFELPDYDRIESAMDQYDKETGTDMEQDPAEKEMPAGSAVPVSLDLKDGTYSVDIVLTGGSGRASVSSPTWLIVKDGKAYARLLWSSSYYDFMAVGGEKYLNESTDGGNSMFTIPVTAFDRPMAVIADTTAMGDPVAIDYKLTFYKESIGGKNRIPQEAARGVIIFAAVIAVVGGILNYVLKKRAER